MLILAGNREDEAPQQAPAAARPSVPQPVSDACKQAAEGAERTGLVSYGGMSSSGAVLHTAPAWVELPFESQRALAECLSHYIARGQDRWVKRIEFRNQATGVTYGVIENTRYRAGN